MQSVTDHLSGLAHRRRLFDALDAYFAQPSADRPRLALLFIDLNGFKRINDAFGHPVGDHVLRLVSARLVAAVRPSDLIARAGGDEFVAMLIGASAQDATEIAMRLGTGLDQPFALDSVTADIGASIGIALAPEDATDSAGLMARADAAMYRAKRDGSRHARYDPRPRRRWQQAGAGRGSDGSDRPRSAAAALPAPAGSALDQISAVEALVRWQHPVHGLIPR